MKKPYLFLWKLTDDPAYQMYWHLEDHDNIAFRYSVDHIKKTVKLNHRHFYEIVSRGIFIVRTCPVCSSKTPDVVRSREALIHILRSENMSLCDDCTQKQYEKEQEELLQTEKIQQEKEINDTANSERAYEAREFQHLKPIEMSMLKACVSINMSGKGSFYDAAKKVGVSKEKGLKIYNYLVRKNFIINTSRGWYCIKLAQEIISQLTNDVTIKPILGPMEKDIYRRLKGKYANIFPKQLLRSFISQELAKSVLEEFPNITFGSFLCMEVDMLVCDEEYRPLRAIEYQGGYHQNLEQKPRDDFKRAICEAAGVPLSAYELSSLWKDSELKELA